ncbi:MAG: hypothetical protein QXI19_12305 [Candidatus Caldarchaeum sp.]
MASNPQRMSKSLVAAGVVNIIGILFLAAAIFNLNPVTLILSVTIGGLFIFLSLALYVANVLYELRRRGIL